MSKIPYKVNHWNLATSYFPYKNHFVFLEIQSHLTPYCFWTPWNFVIKLNLFVACSLNAHNPVQQTHWVQCLQHFTIYLKDLWHKPTTLLLDCLYTSIYFLKNFEACSHRGGGGTHIFDRTGMCSSNGSLFYKKSLNMGPIFYKKILKHGSTFPTEPKFSGFCMAKTSKITKFLKNGHIFQEKSLKMGTLFYQNHP